MEGPVCAVSTADQEARIRELIAEAGLGDAELDRDTDLYDAGMTSHASVRLMLALEDAFDVEFPDEMLQREYFSSVGAIERAIATLLDSDQGV